MVCEKKESRQNAERKPNKITAEDVVNSGYSGVAGDYVEERIPVFNKLKDEKVLSHKDSYIVLGRDRDSFELSGYGGVGHTSAHSIDIVVGRGAANTELHKKIKQVSKAEGERKSVYIDPDFKHDAARIYVSQKSNIDEYFDLNNYYGNGKIGESKEDSAIGIKADSVRIVSRKGTKIVTHTDETDSRGFEISERKGIDLICVPKYDKCLPNIEEVLRKDVRNNMQPIPKGENLAKALENLASQIDTLSGLFINFVQIQSEYNNIVATHTHISPFYAITIPPSLDLVPANIQTNMSIFSETLTDTLEFRMNYLTKFKTDYLNTVSDTYINSRYHHLN